jgi:hypothetical protein
MIFLRPEELRPGVGIRWLRPSLLLEEEASFVKELLTSIRRKSPRSLGAGLGMMSATNIAPIDLSSRGSQEPFFSGESVTTDLSDR